MWTSAKGLLHVALVHYDNLGACRIRRFEIQRLLVTSQLFPVRNILSKSGWNDAGNSSLPAERGFSLQDEIKSDI